MKKTDTKTEEKIILNSLGLLDESEKEQLKSLINNSSGAERKLASEYNNLAAIFPKMAGAKFNEVTPSDEVKKKLFEKIKSSVSPAVKINKEGFGFILSDSDDWVQHPDIEGIKVKQLAVNKDKDYLMILLKVAAGTEYPSHHHSGAEECYVIEGDVYAEGKVLGPGDFHHADADSDHDPLYTKNGCTLLLVVDPKDY